MIAAAALAALLAAAPARADDPPAACPAGTRRVATDNPYEPFRCASASDESKGLLVPVAGPQGFAARPRCPGGSHPVADPGGLQPYRCVVSASGGQDASPSPETDGAIEHRFVLPGEISFEYREPFRVQDDWKEEVPTLYLAIDGSGSGKPVTITVTRYDESQSSYQEMDEAIAHDVEWLGAKDAGTQAVGRGRARVTAIPGDTRSVYLPASKESYYSFVYSAPSSSFEKHLPAFTRLLKTLKLGGEAAR